MRVEAEPMKQLPLNYQEPAANDEDAETETECKSEKGR